MCGFAGWAGEERIERGGASILRAMGSHLAARGPDDETFLERPGFAVTFRRLAINDVKGGKQPFISADGRLIAVVNGEIYNHKALTAEFLSDVIFSTASDCEVVLHLFCKLGAAFLDKLNGIYSIAIWDQHEQTLLLARDRLGVKPLYYTIVDETLVFASELKALLVHPDVPRSIDWEAFHYIPNSTFPFERPADRPVATGVKEVFFVDPASYIEWHAGRLRRSVRYWDAVNPAALENINSAADCVSRYAELVADSVRLQLMSDVPVGLFLSGGLDSSFIAGVAAQHTSCLEAFSLVEPSITRTGDTDAAIKLARHLDIPLHLVRVDQEALTRTMRLDLQSLEYFVWIMDFPLFEVEFLFKHELHRYAKFVQPDMKVILLGQGADEFAGGYSRLGHKTWSEFTENESRALHLSLLRRTEIPLAFRRYVNSSVLEPVANGRSAGHDPWQFLRFGDLAAYNLWHEDRTASANSMEARVPFLDHRLVEFLCSIPPQWQQELFFDKAIERRAALRFLPAEFTQRPKIPLFGRGPGAEDSIFALRRAFLERAFEEYREKYLEPPNSLFSTQEVTWLHDQTAMARTGDAAASLLFRCMSISIFERLCRDVRSSEFGAPQLGTILPPEGTDSIPLRPEITLESTSRIALSESVRLALLCDPDTAILVIENDIVVSRIKISTALSASGSLESIFSGRNLKVADLAGAFGVDIEGIRPLAQAFTERGWGVLLNGVDDGQSFEKSDVQEKPKQYI